MLPSLENITHPCFTDEDLTSCTNMFDMENVGHNLSEKQFLLIACSLANLLKTLHEQNIYLGGVDEDSVQLKPIGQYYLPILQKKNTPFLKKSDNNQDKINDTRLLCKTLLRMNHVESESVNKLLIDAHENKKGSTTLFDDLARLVKTEITNTPADDHFIEVALHAGVEYSTPKAIQIHAQNHRLDELHHLESNNDENVSLADLDEDQRTSLYCARPALAEQETIPEIKATAEVLNRHLWPCAKQLPLLSNSNTLLGFPFLGLFFSIWNMPTQTTASYEEPLHDDSVYIRAFEHLWQKFPYKKNIFLKNIPDEKLNAIMLDAYNENNAEKIAALKPVYENRVIALETLFEQNPQCAADIAFAFWKPEDSNDLFTKFINSHILINKAIDEKLARHVLKWHGVSTGDGKYLSTQVARNIINQRKGTGYGLQEIRGGLLQIIQAIEAYESVLTRRENEKLPLHYFRCHKTSERRSLCREILQNCSEATDANDLCIKLQSCINNLNKFSTIGKSKLAEKLETIQNDLNPKLKKTYFRLF
ncbi:MAG: hypothetical protein WC748_06290 [Legionellales bacterium]|jgi:hypothetical protein